MAQICWVATLESDANITYLSPEDGVLPVASLPYDNS